MNTFKPGLFRNVSPHAYHERRVGVVSKSALDLVDRSPAHYKAWVDGVLAEEETPALFFGSAFHCAVLEPERFETSYVVEPDFGDCRTKANKAARDEWRADNTGRKLLDPADAQTIRGMSEALRAHPLGSKMLQDGEPELTVRWRDEETGLECKSRADYYLERHSMVADIKSSNDASPEAFKRDVAKYAYHRQDALYRAGFAAVGAQVRHFVFLVVEKAPPFAVAVYALDAQAIGKGYGGTRRLIERMSECVKTGVWPGYSTSIEELSLPPWAA